MKPALFVLTLAGAAAIAVTALSAAASTSSTAKPAQPVLYGHVKSIQRAHGRLELRFDPAWWLTGVAAERACGCSPVPNDVFVLDESHRLLTFVVRRDAHVSVLVRGAGPASTASIPVTELAQIVQGRNPKHRRLLEPQAGFWIRIGAKYPAPVLALDQQYQP